MLCCCERIKIKEENDQMRQYDYFKPLIEFTGKKNIPRYIPLP